MYCCCIVSFVTVMVVFQLQILCCMSCYMSYSYGSIPNLNQLQILCIMSLACYMCMYHAITQPYIYHLWQYYVIVQLHVLTCGNIAVDALYHANIQLHVLHLYQVLNKVQVILHFIIHSENKDDGSVEEGTTMTRDKKRATKEKKKKDRDVNNFGTNTNKGIKGFFR